MVILQTAFELWQLTWGAHLTEPSKRVKLLIFSATTPQSTRPIFKLIKLQKRCIVGTVTVVTWLCKHFPYELV